MDLRNQDSTEAFLAGDQCDHDLTENGAKFAKGSGDAVAGATISSWKGFCWDLEDGLEEK